MTRQVWLDREDWRRAVSSGCLRWSVSGGDDLVRQPDIMEARCRDWHSVGDGCHQRNLVSTLTGRRVRQPDNMAIVVGQFEVSRVRRVRRVGLEMTVDRLAWMISIRLVHVLGGQNGRKREAWRQNEADDSPEGESVHLTVIIRDHGQ